MSRTSAPAAAAADLATPAPARLVGLTERPLARPEVFRTRLLDLGLLLGLFALAIWVRWPYYQIIPVFTDELRDVHRAFLITHPDQAVPAARNLQVGIVRFEGWPLPLTGSSAYFGSLWEWLLAATFWASGFSMYLPRSLMLGLGVLTVLACYGLGRAWGGRLGGFIAAALLATSAGHTLINSHVAWSACMTPFFTTLASWALYAAVRGTSTKRHRWLLCSGLCWGLALQTHPAVLALLPGAAAFLLWRGRALVHSRWVVLSAGLFLLVNANLLAYNLMTGLGSISQGLERSAGYAQQEELTPELYLHRLGLLLVMLLRVLGGAVETVPDRGYLYDPSLLVMGLVTTAAVVWIWRRGNPLPGLLLLSVTLVMPLFNGRFDHALHMRYLMPLLPMLYGAVGALGAFSLDGLRRRGRPVGRWPLAPAQLGQVALGLAIGFLVLHPLLYLSSYYRGALRAGHTNTHIFETVEQIKANQRTVLPVLLDEELMDVAYREPNSWRLSTVLQVLLGVEGIRSQSIQLDPGKTFEPGQLCPGQLIVLASSDRQHLDSITSRLELRSAGPELSRPGARSSRYRLYRLQRTPGAAVGGECG